MKGGRSTPPTRRVAYTNAQNQAFWGDPALRDAAVKNDDTALVARKKVDKQRLFDEVVNQTGDLYDPDVFILV